MSLFDYVPHPRIAARQLQPPTTVKQQHKAGFNGWLAGVITEGVGTMWGAYAFAALALVALPKAIQGGTLSTVQWVSQTFLQLTLLSIIMVGQQVLGAASDQRAINTYADAEAILREAQQIQAHLLAQDEALELLATRLGVEVKALKTAPQELPRAAGLSDAAEAASSPDAGAESHPEAGEA
jgi:hypothetical protein